MAVATIDFDTMRQIAEPTFSIGQIEWPHGQLVRVDVYDEQAGYSRSEYKLAETDAKGARKAVAALRRYIEQTLAERLDDEHRFSVTPHDNKHGVTISLLWESTADDACGDPVIEANVSVWYEAF